MTSIDHKSFYFHTICDYMILLNQFEEIVEENNFSHYAFGLSNFQEYLIDEKLTRIVALKKMLHSLLNIKKDLHNSAEFLPKYTDRINFLELKLKSRLKLETHNETQNTVIDEKINSDSNSSFFESNSKDLQINEVSTNKLCNETNVKFNNLNEFKNQLETKEGTNEDLKDDLLELAKEMKDSALRFGELMKKEKKILIDLDKEQIYKMDQTTKSTQEMQTLNKLMKMSFISMIFMLLTSLALFILTIIYISLT